MKLPVILLCAVVALAAPAVAGEPDAALRASLQRDVDTHLAAEHDQRHSSYDRVPAMLDAYVLRQRRAILLRRIA